MPKLLGMEPDTVQKLKVPLLIGGGGLLLYFTLKGKGVQPVAAEAPSGAAPPAGVISPAAAPELSQSGKIVDALQQQMQEAQLKYDIAASNLGLQAQQQQLAYQGQVQQQQLASNAEALSFQYRVDRGYNPGKRGGVAGFFDSVASLFGAATGAANAFTGATNAASNAERAISNFGVPQQRQPFYPTPTGRPIGQ